ncbi:MAG: hypothetical protein PWR24_1066 [Desulfonauticus sp.]|jgi:DNA-directed RNA polymerase subunit RPC12/RpoP|nr:MAG: Uncharacterized protein XD41_0795 [Desulfonauticus sp. 38_4375]MDK2921509.1 hypothetical protein [Desulfonauticus sp.]
MSKQEPIWPTDVEILLFYPCPKCQRKMPVIAPLEPTMIKCDQCGYSYPLAPVKVEDILYLKTVLAGGLSLVDENLA